MWLQTYTYIYIYIQYIYIINICPQGFSEHYLLFPIHHNVGNLLGCVMIKWFALSRFFWANHSIFGMTIFCCAYGSSYITTLFPRNSQGGFSSAPQFWLKKIQILQDSRHTEQCPQKKHGRDSSIDLSKVTMCETDIMVKHRINYP